MDENTAKRLKQLQASLNSQIDAYLTTSPDKAAAALLQNEIASLTSEIQDEVVPASAHIYMLAVQSTVNMAVRIGIDLNIFSIIGDEPTTLGELAQVTAAEPDFLLRILRLLVATNTLKEHKVGNYSATARSKALSAPGTCETIKCTFDSVNKHYYSVPAYLAKHGYKEMTMTSNSILAEYGVNFWELLSRDPAKVKDFESAMHINQALPQEYRPQYPFAKVASETANDRVFLVDVGGGHGAFLKELIPQDSSFTNQAFVLQDLAGIISNVDKASLPQNVETAPLDITIHPQPVKGAKIYFFRHVFHGLSDSGVIQALKGMRLAYERGYSRLLIYEQVIPQKCTAMEAMQDVNIVMLCSKERNELQWKEVLEAGGFLIKNISRAAIGALSIIEADMA